MDDITKTGIFILISVLMGGMLTYNAPQKPNVEIIKTIEVINRDINEFLADNLWHCFTTDARINYVVVLSKEKPHYLPVPGNEKLDFHCRSIEVVDFKSYKPQ